MDTTTQSRDDLPKTRVEAVLRRWRAHPEQLITYRQAEDAYCGPTQGARPLDSHSRDYVGMSLTRILKRYGSKTGPAGSQTPWKYGTPTMGGNQRPGFCHGCQHTDRHGKGCLAYVPSSAPIQPPDTITVLVPTGLSLPAYPPHLQGKSPELLEAESKMVWAKEQMLAAQRRYAEQEQKVRELILEERWLVWAREQVKGLSDQHALRALALAALERGKAVAS